MKINSPEEALNQLKLGNKVYITAESNPAKQFLQIRAETATNGQVPYAVILTCSDSRVPAEHIFSAGIGELFVIRTAGNVVSDFDLGSIEYGCEHLGAKVIVVMGHTHCGAIGAALQGGAAGYINKIVEEIKVGLYEGDTEVAATNHNIAHSVEKIKGSSLIQNLLKKNEVALVSAKYDIETGEVSFLD